jgi:hypothetical protein
MGVVLAAVALLQGGAIISSRLKRQTVHPPSWAASGRDAKVFEAGVIYRIVPGYVLCVTLADYAQAAEQLPAGPEVIGQRGMMARTAFLGRHPGCRRTWDLRQLTVLPDSGPAQWYVAFRVVTEEGVTPEVTYTSPRALEYDHEAGPDEAVPAPVF